mgnify:FL=1
MTILEALKDFIEEQAYKGNSARTIDFYEHTVKYFVKESGVTLLSDLTEQS